MRRLLLYPIAAIAPLMAQLPLTNTVPAREFGQAKLSSPVISSVPNLVEGKELNQPVQVALDPSSSANLYVVDTGNNRVLAWKNAAGLTNGKAADRVIGQPDMFTTQAEGPGTSLPGGLNQPSSAVVDRNGNLYVADTGNNRVLRFPAPFSQTATVLQTDLVIGQNTLFSGAANQGLAAPTAQTLSLLCLNLPRAGITMDAQGDLWVTDVCNNRVLRFPPSQLTPGTIAPKADMVIGEPDFTSTTAASTVVNLTNFAFPVSIGVGASGGIYIGDTLGRVLYFATPATGASASRILGTSPAAQPQNPNAFTLAAPECIVTSGDAALVCDTTSSRILVFGAPSTWPSGDPTLSPAALSVIGQTDFVSNSANRGQAEPDANTFANAAGAALDSSGNLWVADAGNNRVLKLPFSANSNFTTASLVIGQIDFPYDSINLIEGKEVFFFNQGGGAGIAVDRTSSPPRLYIADTLNNRILGFKDARAVGVDARGVVQGKADIVIGQPDFFRSVQNYPNGNATSNDSGLFHPLGLAVVGGDLYVCDSGNGRVLRFPAPFSQPSGAMQHANLVLGQSSFTQIVTNPTALNMQNPYGIAAFADGSISVSDSVQNRVLIFLKPHGGDFSNGQTAATVLGQATFDASAASSDATGLNSPRHLAADTFGRLYVTDTNNARVVVYTGAESAASGASGSVIPGFSIPIAVAINTTGEIWVADVGTNQLSRLPPFATLQANLNQVVQTITINGPLALALDASDNPLIAESSNRLSMYYPAMYYRSPASFAASPAVAPGMMLSLLRYGQDFSFTPAPVASMTYPNVLQGLEAFVNGAPAPMYNVSSDRVSVIVPEAAPASGTADFVLLSQATNEILGSGTFSMAPAFPSFFTINGQGTGQIAAINFDDNSVNGPSHPVARGRIISLWLTGLGQANNAPADGHGINAQFTNGTPTVIVNGAPLASNQILYWGLTVFPGANVIIIQVPASVPPASNISVFVSLDGVLSNIGGTTSPIPGIPGPDRLLQVSNGLVTTIAVSN